MGGDVRNIGSFQDWQRAFAEGQVQRHHTVTAIGIAAHDGVDRLIGAFVVDVAINPRIAVAVSRHLVHTVGLVVDGQVQRHHTVATGYVGQRVGRRIGTLGVGVAVNPSIAVACRHLVDAVGDRIHREGHGHHGVAAVGGGQDGILRAGRVEHHIIPSVGQFSLADRPCIRSGGNIAFLNHEIIHSGSVVVLALAAQNDVSCTGIANRHFVGVPARFFLGGDITAFH